MAILAAWLLAGVASPRAVRAQEPVASPLGARGAERTVAASAPLSASLGVNADLLAYDPALREAALDWAQEAGVPLLRVPLRWAELEPSPGAPRLESVRALAEAIEYRGLRWVSTLETSPDWARRDPPPDPALWLCEEERPSPPGAEREAPPTEPRDLADFAVEVARAAGPSLVAVEVWREPNLLPRWRATGPDPEDYGRLLETVAGALREDAPGLAILSAAPAPTTELHPCAMDDLVFLDRLARSGALDGVDGVGVAPLGLRDAPGAPPDPARLNFRRAELARARLLRQGVAAPLWAMAWGWAADRAEAGDSSSSPFGSHPPGTAAGYLREGWALARGQQPWLGPMFVWHWRPVAADGDPSLGYALRDARGRDTALGRAARDIAAGTVEPIDAAAAPETSEGGTGALRTPAGLAALGLVLAALLGGLAAFGRRRGWHDRLRARLQGPLAWRRGAVAVGMGTALLASALAAPCGSWRASCLLPWPVGLGALAVAAALAALQPPLAIGAVFALAPFFYGVRLSLGPSAVGPVEMAIVLALAGALARRWLASDPLPRLSAPSALRAHPLDLAALGLLLWASLSLLWAELPGPARYEWRTVILEPLLVYALLRTLRPRRDLILALDGALLGGALAALWALAGMASALLGGEGAAAAEGVLRALGPYASPNNLALLLGRLATAASAALVIGATSAGALGGLGRRRTRAYALALAPIGLSLLLAFSRGTLLLGLPAGGLFLLLLAGRGRLRRRPVLAALGMAALLALLLLPVAGTERLRGALRVAPGSTPYIRLHLWQASLEMGADQPWLGVGLDNFLYAYRERYVHREVIQERSLSHPHNLALDFWTRLGLPGLALLAAMVGLQALAAWRAIRAGALRAGAPRAGTRAVARARAAPGRPESTRSGPGAGEPAAESRDRPEGGPVAAGARNSEALSSAPSDEPSDAPSDASSDAPSAGPSPGWRGALLAAALGMQVYALAHGLVDNLFFLVDLALLWWLAQAILAGLDPRSGPTRI